MGKYWFFGIHAVHYAVFAAELAAMIVGRIPDLPIIDVGVPRRGEEVGFVVVEDID